MGRIRRLTGPSRCNCCRYASCWTLEVLADACALCEGGVSGARGDCTVQRWEAIVYIGKTEKVSVEIEFPDDSDSGAYAVHHIGMEDIAGNSRGVYFSQSSSSPAENPIKFDELSPSIEILTRNPDTIPPEMNLRDIRIKAEPTCPKDPNAKRELTST